MEAFFMTGEVASSGIGGLIESLGFPVVAVLGLCWYVNKIHKETMGMQLRQEQASQEAIREARESNKELLLSNRELLGTNRVLADSIVKKVDNIENNILEIKKTLENR